MRVPIQSAQVGIYSYGRLGKNAQPVGATYYIDVTGLRDPMSNRGFKKLYKDGRAGEVQQFVREDPRMDAILDTIEMIVYAAWKSENTAEGRWLSFAMKDHHGTWTAPAVAEIVADHLSKLGYHVATWHYELNNEIGGAN